MSALLAVDVGNSNLKFGLHDGTAWTHHWPVATVRDKMPDEYAVLLRSFLQEARLGPQEVGRTVISSVVPQLTRGLVEMLHRQTGRPPLEVSIDLDLPISIDTESPKAVGSDLIANAVAGHVKTPGACVVVAFGTATTLTEVSAAGVLRGVSIAAGLLATANGLVKDAAQLPHVALEPPPSVLGRNTREAMQSGLVLGHLAMVEGLVARILAEHGPHQVIATGGLAETLARHTRVFDRVDPLLTLEGLRTIASLNPR